MLTAPAIARAADPCSCRFHGGEIEEGPPGATYSVACDHGGVKQRAESIARRFLAAQDRDALVAVVGEAWFGEGRYIGDLSSRDWQRAYRVVDALLGNDAPADPT